MEPGGAWNQVCLRERLFQSFQSITHHVHIVSLQGEKVKCSLEEWEYD
jgi:hypothetical protein